MMEKRKANLDKRHYHGAALAASYIYRYLVRKGEGHHGRSERQVGISSYSHISFLPKFNIFHYQNHGCGENGYLGALLF